MVVQGFYRFPCFMVVKGMRNHPSEQPNVTNTLINTALGVSEFMKRRQLLHSAISVVISTGRRRASTVTPERAKTIIHQAKAAWLGGDAQAFANLFTATGKFIVPGQSWQGRTAILDAFNKFMASYQVNAIDIHNFVIQSDHAFVEWFWEEVALDSGDVSRAEDVIAIDFQGHLIHRWREYIDSDSVSS